jgi:hypothetical protein
MKFQPARVDFPTFVEQWSTRTYGSLNEGRDQWIKATSHPWSLRVGFQGRLRLALAKELSHPLPSFCVFQSCGICSPLCLSVSVSSLILVLEVRKGTSWAMGRAGCCFSAAEVKAAATPHCSLLCHLCICSLCALVHAVLSGWNAIPALRSF